MSRSFSVSSMRRKRRRGMNTDQLETLLRGWGLTGRPEEVEDGIHSWRCSHPARYGRCRCFQEAISELSEFIRQEREEAWDEGFSVATRNTIHSPHPMAEWNPYRKEKQ